jgi:hypothetical protein
MSETFLEIKRLVKSGILDNNKGFSSKEILANTNNIKKGTARNFPGKHAIGGQEVPICYFEKVAPAKYRIRPKYLS